MLRLGYLYAMRNCIFYCFLLLSISGFSQNMTAGELLRRAISYHDPDSEWSAFSYTLTFKETRPQGPERSTVAQIDNSRGFFKVNRNNEEIHGMLMDSCFVERGDFDCARAERMRNYYVYLWGLPMKLMDEGTMLDSEVSEVDYNGIPCYVLKVK